jgi:hypothetical protein
MRRKPARVYPPLKQVRQSPILIVLRLQVSFMLILASYRTMNTALPAVTYFEPRVPAIFKLWAFIFLTSKIWKPKF